MDKDEGKKPARPLAAKSSADGGKPENGSSSITEDFMKKISTNVMSPITANRPGRLPSFRTERDLTLGAANSLSTAVAPKKVFKPTIPTRRGKTQDASEKVEEKVQPERPAGRGRGRGKDGVRGRGRGRSDNYIQTTGSVFGEGIADLATKKAGRSEYSRDSAAGQMEKPKLNMQFGKINKEEEDARLDRLLKADFISDLHNDDDSSLIPVQLPKHNLSQFMKEELKMDPDEGPKPEIAKVGDVTIKQEKMDEDDSAVSIKTEKTEPSTNRRVIPSEVQVADMFANDGNLIFFQLPDVLPSLTVDKDRPEIKLEPGKSKEEKVEEPVQTEKEGVLNSLPEGKLGTLRIHQSGKVTMMLGDHLFELDSGTQVSFLQDLVSVDVNKEAKTGNMAVLGSIKYKAVCIPDWNRLIDT